MFTITDETHPDDAKNNDFMFQVTDRDERINFDYFNVTGNFVSNNELSTEGLGEDFRSRVVKEIGEMIESGEKIRKFNYPH